MDLQLSIVIPCFNEEIFIGRCLSSIGECMQAIGYEIIVVDNGSTDATAAIAQTFAQVSVYSIERGTIGRARNFGAKRSAATLIAFIDADVVITPSWAQALSAFIDNGAGGRDFIGGSTYSIRERASMIERAWFATILQVPAKYLNGGNIVVSRRAFEKIGGFDEFLQTGEDFDFCERAVREGMRIAFDPAVEAIHLGYPMAVGQFFRRESWHGIGDFQSVRLFLRSKVALAAVIFFLFIAAAATLLATGYYRTGSAALATHLVLPVLFTVHKFKFANGRYFLVQNFLSYIYLWARIWSPVRLLLERK